MEEDCVEYTFHLLAGQLRTQWSRGGFGEGGVHNTFDNALGTSSVDKELDDVFWRSARGQRHIYHLSRILMAVASAKSTSQRMIEDGGVFRFGSQMARVVRLKVGPIEVSLSGRG